MLRHFSTLEKVIIAVLLVVIASTSTYLYQRFIRDHSELVADEGGIYTEGLVGKAQFLNPVLLAGNTVDSDISRLIFSGLTKYNPHTGLIEDDIATSEQSKDNLSYTFTLLPDVTWHDGTAVTAADVLFTYQTVLQNEAFPNESLKQAFENVTITQIDERTVQFQLEQPYSFFLANVTIGLLPEHILGFVPVDNLDKAAFNQEPIGTGPFRFDRWSATEDTSEITLLRNETYYGQVPKIQTVILRVFPSESALLLAENTLSGFRIPSGQSPEQLFSAASRYQYFPYTLPQYSALFLNTEADRLTNKKVRFALLLATDKEEIRAAIRNSEVVDTPILESKADLDIEFSLERAMGAFFDTEWHLPKKLKERLEEEASEEDSTGGPIRSDFFDDEEELVFVLKGKEDSWISLQTDGSTQPSFLLQRGGEKSFTVSQSLTFTTIGNAAGLDIEVNGVPLKSLGDSGVVLRNLIFSRNTLVDYVEDSFSEGDESSSSEETEELDDEEDAPVEEPEEEPSSEDPEEEGTAEEAEEEIIEPETPSEPESEQIRINEDGERLILRLVTAQNPPIFLTVAELIQNQWKKAGAKVVIETYSIPELQEKIRERDYDILLFGQNLGYNLDAFPFWHSSQAENGLNLSNYRSLEADNLLVDIRKTFDERTKQEYLDRLKGVIAEDTPAVFLYNPLHYYAVDGKVKNVQFDDLSSHADRFADISTWYINETYQLNEAFSFSLLLRWIFS